MSFFGFGKKKEEMSVGTPLPVPEEASSKPMDASQGISPAVDAAAFLPKKEDFPFEHISSLPFDMEPSPVSPPVEQATPTPEPQMLAPEHILNEAPSPEEHPEMDLSELSRQLPIQDVPRPPEQGMSSDETMDLSLDIPDDLMMSETEPEQAQEVKREVLPEFASQEFEEMQSPHEEMVPLQVAEHSRFDEPSDMGSELLGSDRKVRRFKVTKINGELFVEAESYKFFLENMVTMHEDLRRTNDLFLKYSNENIDEDQLYKKMFQQLNNIHEDLIKIDHQLFERE
ncbi:MAG: hypothetical protein AABX70_06855 [Nanoarchaeota archaeon]